MYIAPNTEIRVLNNVPLDNTYEHTINFANSSAQSSYFIGKTKYAFTAQSYQRVQRGRCRVNRKADDLYDCNYMMFQNTSFGTKWFYAFITSVEYLNNITSEITFEIDIMQTWYFNFTREMCYVDRCHFPTDVIGEHIEPEPVSLGEYVYNSYSNLTPALDDLCTIIAIADKSADVDGSVYDGVYGGATLYAYNMTDTSGINSKLNEYLQASDSIVAMYVAPKYAAVGNAVIPTTGTKLTDQQTGRFYSFQIDAISKTTVLDDGFVPKNRKLYTYPYTLFNVNDASGGSLNLRYEFFKNLSPYFNVHTTVTQPVQMILRPGEYKGSGDIENTLESLTLSDYPMCSWSTDAYKAWVAQNSIPLMANAVAQPVQQMVRGATVGGALGAGAGLLTGAIQTAYETWQKNYTASIQADLYKGQNNNGNGNVAARKQSFWGGRMSQPKVYLKMFDDFFTAYGYTCNKIMIPPVNNRTHWTYCKTVGCNLTGSVPADDMRRLCQIFDKGITFWNTPSEIGDYSLDNTVS